MKLPNKEQTLRKHWKTLWDTGSFTDTHLSRLFSPNTPSILHEKKIFHTVCSGFWDSQKTKESLLWVYWNENPWKVKDSETIFWSNNWCTTQILISLSFTLFFKSHFLLLPTPFPPSPVISTQCALIHAEEVCEISKRWRNRSTEGIGMQISNEKAQRYPQTTLLTYNFVTNSWLESHTTPYHRCWQGSPSSQFIFFNQFSPSVEL